jgi:hypothetical protein
MMNKFIPRQIWLNLVRSLAIAIFLSISGAAVLAQGGAQILYGDLKIDESGVSGMKPQT